MSETSQAVGGIKSNKRLSRVIISESSDSESEDSTNLNVDDNNISENDDVFNNQNENSNLGDLYEAVHQNTLNDSEVESDDDKTVEQMVDSAKKGIFPKKVFKFGSEEKTYSPIYQFFECQREFETKPSHSIEFVCKIKKCVEHYKIGNSTNLTKHLVPNTLFSTQNDVFNNKKRKFFYLINVVLNPEKRRIYKKNSKIRRFKKNKSHF